MKLNLSKTKWNKISESDHFIFYTFAGVKINQSEIEKCENKFNQIIKYFNFAKSNFKIKYYFCPSLKKIKTISSIKTYGICDFENKVLLSYYSYHPHEIVHHVIYQNLKSYGHRAIDEGLGVLFGSHNPKRIDWWGKPLDYWKKINEQNWKITDNQLLKNFDNIDSKKSYPLAAIYVNNLIKKLGKKKFINKYRTKKLI